ncbi:SusC/RagA family TonB-linked outer membrane protein [Chitinophaga parva]|uniref:SusC/RagA family TonB-linked outer membrane protein n=1 Tax=Chitinophaga parva TaxID=2169414 RepID=UPI00140350AF|nr:SusC/RagA family TonB-linked outer membrane protein [Chitinophaga parva]
MDRKVSLNLLNSNLRAILTQIESLAQVSFAVNGSSIVVKDNTGATHRAPSTVRAPLQGVVMNEHREAIPGVSVFNPNSGSDSVFTNDKGIFVVPARKGDLILVIAAGYREKMLTVNDERSYEITLQADTSRKLNEVVVTALGIRKEKKSLGYTVQQVSGETLEKVKAPTAMSGLTGKVAGLNIANTTDFFQAPSVSLRGQKPLIVIDGIPDLEGDAFKINADDIESVSVLKGTSAAALYGSIGKNGAIMYNTKRGRKGDVKVELNSSTLLQTGYLRIPKVQTEYGDGNYGKYAYIDGSGGGTEGGGWLWGPKLDQKDPTTPSGYFETPQYNSPVDPATGKLVPLPWVSRGKNNLKNFFRTGLLSTNNLSATWGGDKGTFRVSAGEIFQKGVMPNTSMNNASFSVSGNYNLSKRLNVDGRLSYNREFSNNYPTTGYGPDNILYNLVLWTGADVDIRDLKNYWVKGKEGLQQKNYNNSWYNNPYFVAYQYLQGYRKDNVFGSFALNYDISPSFSAKLRTGINEYGTDETTQEPKSYIGYSSISNGNLFYTKKGYFDITSDFILSYKHDFSQNFSLSARAGGANQYSNYRRLFSRTDGLTIPGFYSLGNSTNPLYSENTLQEKQIKSLYGMVDAELYHFIYLGITGRNDWVSTLPVRNNSFFYPSVTGAVVLSDVLKLPAAVSFLKARGSWSQVNSGAIDANDPYASIQTYSLANKWNNVPALSWGAELISPHLIPSTTQSWETGLVIGLLQNRVNLDLTYFQNREYNNFASVGMSLASGYGTRLVNADEYKRKGWEMVLSLVPVKTSQFQWQTGFNVSNSHRWLTEATYSLDGYKDNLKVGERSDKIFTGVYQTTPDGQVIYGSNGMPLSDAYQRAVGYGDPKWIYGWQNSFNYKQFTLTCSMDGRLGGLIYSTTNLKMIWGGSSPATANHFRDEAYQGLQTYVGKGVVVTSGNVQYDNHGNILSDTRTYAPNKTPVNYVSYMTSTNDAPAYNYFYYSGTYIKLREVVLTYNISPAFLKRTRVFSSASASLIGNNLLMFAKLPNVDPDAEGDNLQTPSLRSVGVNLNLKF